jgi:hypothetical protein
VLKCDTRHTGFQFLEFRPTVKTCKSYVVTKSDKSDVVHGGRYTMQHRNRHRYTALTSHLRPPGVDYSLGLHIVSR